MLPIATHIEVDGVKYTVSRVEPLSGVRTNETSVTWEVCCGERLIGRFERRGFLQYDDLPQAIRELVAR